MAQSIHANRDLPKAKVNEKKRAARFFLHSTRDSELIVLAVCNFVCSVYATLEFQSLSLYWLSGLGAVCVFLQCTNYQCISHNFIHNRFFKSDFLNHAFSIFNSLVLGVPQSMYEAHHLNHHQFNNREGDFSTIYLWSESKVPPTRESSWSYSLVGPVRANLGKLYRFARQLRLHRRIQAELAAVVIFNLYLVVMSWRGFLFFYLPVLYFGQVLAYLENYLEHSGALVGDVKRDSVSSYGSFYNLVWFNNGYHQEHHYRPKIHWTEIPKIRTSLPPETERHVVKWAHFTNTGRSSLS
jgi:fatty acid desaturase